MQIDFCKQQHVISKNKKAGLKKVTPFRNEIEVNDLYEFVVFDLEDSLGGKMRI